jgi:hypothetical protein
MWPESQFRSTQMGRDASTASVGTGRPTLNPRQGSCSGPGRRRAKAGRYRVGDPSDQAVELGEARSNRRGEIPGVSTSESAELRAAPRRIRELETELAVVRQAAKFLGEDRPAPKGSSRRSNVLPTPGSLSTVPGWSTCPAGAALLRVGRIGLVSWPVGVAGRGANSAVGAAA